ncbi:MAG: hypothetical protein EB127_10925, partial [Alphaproteobacteria bacterium]|nr:hypothetical protein [Alphaproteobacteria bacterium]
QPDQFKKIAINYNSVNNWSYSELPYTAISSNLKPSGEIPMHFGLQKKLGQHNKDVRVVVHIHPTYCVAAMHAGVQLDKLVKDFPELGRYTKVAPNVPDVAPISQELADRVHQNLDLD